MAAMKFRLVSAASVNLAKIKDAGPCNLKGAVLINTNAAARFVKLYDSTDLPIIGTTIPALTVQVAPTSQVALTFSDGVAFRGSMWFATTVNAADADAMPVGAGDIVASVFYE